MTTRQGRWPGQHPLRSRRSGPPAKIYLFSHVVALTGLAITATTAETRCERRGLNINIGPLSLDSTHAGRLRMFLTQPPAQRVIVDYRDGTRADCFQLVVNMNGITISDVLKTMKTEMPNTHRVFTIHTGLINGLFKREHLRTAIDAGIKKFRDLESKIGRPNAVRIVGRARMQ